MKGTWEEDVLYAIFPPDVFAYRPLKKNYRTADIIHQGLKGWIAVYWTKNSGLNLIHEVSSFICITCKIPNKINI